MMRRMLNGWWIMGGLVLTGTNALPAADAGPQRELGVTMLRQSKSLLLEQYYDPTLGGFDLEGRCVTAEKRIATAGSNAEIFRIIAQVFLDLGDAHTLFIPPPRAVQLEYGWKGMVVGDACYVYRLTAKSDAAKKGLALGDRIESIDGLAANRQSWATLQYLFNGLDPQAGLRVVAVSPAGERRELDLQAEVKTRARELSRESAEYSRMVLKEEENTDRWQDQFARLDDVLVWRLRRLDDDAATLREGLSRLGKAKSVVLDLRGNSGGSEEKLLKLLGMFFDHPVQVGEVRSRAKTKPLVVAPAANPFRGIVIALVDAHTGAAAEICARVLQLEDRGVVVGDRTKGDVQSGEVAVAFAGTSGIPFGLEVTVASIVMRDGRSLEKTGMAPDLLVRPTGADLARRSDPALAKALAQLAKKLTPEEAGKLLPWKVPDGEL